METQKLRQRCRCELQLQKHSKEIYMSHHIDKILLRPSCIMVTWSSTLRLRWWRQGHKKWWRHCRSESDNRFQRILFSTCILGSMASPGDNRITENRLCSAWQDLEQRRYRRCESLLTCNVYAAEQYKNAAPLSETCSMWLMTLPRMRMAGCQ